jgi:hypothetical protein
MSKYEESLGFALVASLKGSIYLDVLKVFDFGLESKFTCVKVFDFRFGIKILHVLKFLI